MVLENPVKNSFNPKKGLGNFTLNTVSFLRAVVAVLYVLHKILTES